MDKNPLRLRRSPPRLLLRHRSCGALPHVLPEVRPQLRRAITVSNGNRECKDILGAAGKLAPFNDRARSWRGQLAGDVRMSPLSLPLLVMFRLCYLTIGP